MYTSRAVRGVLCLPARRYKSATPSILRGLNLQEILEADGTKSTKDERLQKKAPAKALKITGPMLNDIYRNPVTNPKPTRAEVSYANNFFNKARKKLNWIVYDFKNIPGEKERLEREEEHSMYAEEGMGDDIEGSVAPNKEEWEDPTEPSENEKNRLLKETKKQELISVKNNLPEVLFLGRCNVGKSSLINSLFSDLSNKKTLLSYARVKDHPGYTQSLNFFNIGGLCRIVDSPGYGVKGKPWQGELTLEYIQNRRNLRKIYVLVSLKDGIKPADEHMIDFLMEHKIPFDFVITKIDRLVTKKSMTKEECISKLEEFLIPQLDIGDAVLQPNLHFVNNIQTEATQGKKTGFDELRINILKSCGFESLAAIKPVYYAKEHDNNQKAAKKVGDMDNRFN